MKTFPASYTASDVSKWLYCFQDVNGSCVLDAEHGDKIWKELKLLVIAGRRKVGRKRCKLFKSKLNIDTKTLNIWRTR